MKFPTFALFLAWLFATAASAQGPVAPTVLPADPLFVQMITGTWQGAIPVRGAPDGQFRLQFRISATNANGLTAVLYNIDPPPPGLLPPAAVWPVGPLPGDVVMLMGSGFKILAPGIGGTYRGTLNSDGNTITGTWIQGRRWPMNLTRATDQTQWAIPASPTPVTHMAPNAGPVFATATIRPSSPNESIFGIFVKGRRLSTFRTSLSYLILNAYGLQASQIIGAPAWFETEKYDITAEPAGEGQPSHEQWMAMLQNLIAQRFQLSFHRDSQELPVYVLAVAQTGPRLTQSQSTPNGGGFGVRGFGTVFIRNKTMADFARGMQSTIMDRPVVDRTALPGNFDFTLNWTPDASQYPGTMMKKGTAPPRPANAQAWPDLYTAIQQQLGLTLQATTAFTEVIVIDNVEQPSEK